MQALLLLVWAGLLAMNISGTAHISWVVVWLLVIVIARVLSLAATRTRGPGSVTDLDCARALLLFLLGAAALRVAIQNRIDRRSAW